LFSYFFSKLPLVSGWASHIKDDGTFFYGRLGLALLMFNATDTQQFALPLLLSTFSVSVDDPF
jgi:hypothetical protein